jgi:transcriptional regulator with XRE-family HTH domain
MTNEDFGRRIGVGQSMASRIRNGRRLPGVATMHRIHEELGIPLSDLVVAHEAGSQEFGRLIRQHLSTPVSV